MTFEYEKEQYDQNGFVIVRQLLADKDFTELKQNLDRYIRDVVHMHLLFMSLTSRMPN